MGSVKARSLPRESVLAMSRTPGGVQNVSAEKVCAHSSAPMLHQQKKFELILRPQFFTRSSERNYLQYVSVLGGRFGYFLFFSGRGGGRGSLRRQEGGGIGS